MGFKFRVGRKPLDRGAITESGLWTIEHFRRSGADECAIDFRWSKIDYVRNDKLLEPILDRTSLLANLALGTAVAEWIVWRLHRFGDASLPLQVVSHTWAAQAALENVLVWREPSTANVAEQIMYTACHCLRNVHECVSIREPGASIYVVYIIKIARAVLPARARFRDWLEEIVVRLRRHHRRDKKKNWGLGVPVLPAELEPR